MFDPSQWTLGQVSAVVRDLSIVGILVGASWKLRGAYEAVVKFVERTETHMDVMEAGMDTLLTNHLTHIEKQINKMAERHVRASDMEMSDEANDAPSEK